MVGLISCFSHPSHLIIITFRFISLTPCTTVTALSHYMRPRFTTHHVLIFFSPMRRIWVKLRESHAAARRVLDSALLATYQKATTPKRAHETFYLKISSSARSFFVTPYLDRWIPKPPSLTHWNLSSESQNTSQTKLTWMSGTGLSQDLYALNLSQDLYTLNFKCPVDGAHSLIVSQNAPKNQTFLVLIQGHSYLHSNFKPKSSHE